MNGTSNGEKPESNKNVIFVVVLTLCVNGTIGVSALAYCLITERELNVALLTAFVGIINYVLGAVSGMLAKTSPTSPTPTEQKLSGSVTVPEQQLETNP